MLVLGTVRHEAVAYYLDPALADSEGGRAQGVFLGQLAKDLELLHRPADARTLPMLLSGVDPNTGEVLDARHRRVHVAAYDCTFAAPKSVSLLASLAGSEAVAGVLLAHDTSVAAVLAYLEQHGALVRRGASQQVQPASGLCAAAFLHRTSRANDPHLHSHVLIANLGADWSGHFSALDGRGLFEHAAVAGALYRSNLRFELSSRFGLSWKPEQRGFNDLVGLPRRAIEEFSSRQRTIEDELARSGRQGPSAATLAAHHTRPPKDRVSSFDDLAEGWWRRGHRVGIARSHIDSMLEPNQVAVEPSSSPSSLGEAHEVTSAAQRAIANFPGRFSRDDLLRATCARLPSGAEVATLEEKVDKVLASEAVVPLAPGGARHGVARQIPAARLEPRYLSSQAAAAGAANEALIASARSFGALRREEPVPSGIFRGEGDGVLVELAARALRAEQMMQGLAVGKAVAAHLEALTAIASTTPTVVLSSGSRAKTGRPGEVLVLFGAEQFAPRELQALLEGARADRSAVVLVDRSKDRHSTLATPAGRVSLCLEEVGATRVLRAPDPGTAIAAFEELRFSLSHDGQQVLPVTVEPTLLAAPSMSPRLARAALAHKKGSIALVLGSAAVFGEGLSAVEDARRVHVVVAPRLREAGADRAAVLEIAQPRELLERLGPVPREIDRRALWRREAVRLEPRGVLRGLGSSKGYNLSRRESRSLGLGR